MVTPENVLAVHRALAGAGVPHAIGGAVALGLYGAPRDTVDIDVNVFVTVPGWEEVRLTWDGANVHLFFDLDDLHAAMPAAVRQMELGGATIPVVSPEHLIVRKALLDREKDRPDVEALLRATEIDRAEVDRWLAHLAAPDDPRLARFRALADRLCP
jgi:hypothetical protein